ncbi:MAG: glycosyltransferase, partial [Bdellovibrio sp.]|nr:glycosyltransferase [Bdellovibrio sp.]
MNPLVSVITPAYNAEKFIAETIDSVRAQTHTNWEHLIVVDSKTSDQTRAIVAQYAKKDSRIHLLEDALVSGVSENRNLALKKAQGEYIAFLDSDDLWLPRKLEMQLRYMQKQDSSFCFHSYEVINENGDALNQDRRAPLIATYRSLLQHNCI